MINILITICARSGSKGAVGKNTRIFLGKPLIYYTLKSAKLFAESSKHKYTTDIVVSSDSNEILAKADMFGGIYKLKRAAELSQDTSPKVPVIQDATLFMESQLFKKYDYVLDLDVTAPLRLTSEIEKVLHKCMDDSANYEVVFTATSSRRNPYFNMVEVVSGYATKCKDSDFASRQQAPPVYDMCPSIYCFERNSLLNKLKRLTFEGVSGLVEIEDTYVIDIDTESDFEILELLVLHHYRTKYSEIFDESGV